MASRGGKSAFAVGLYLRVDCCQAGDELMVMVSEERAKKISDARTQRSLLVRHHADCEDIRAHDAELAAVAEGDIMPELDQLVLILKADVQVNL